MGNTKSLQAFPTEACVSTIVKTVNTFGPLFVKAYGVVVLRKLQQLHEEQESGGPDALLAEKEGYLLERPPLATEPMERGWIVKLGEVKKNWKRRFFVATEEADGFVVYYFERERDATNQSKAKGCIHPCGYLVRNSTPEEDIRDKKSDKDVPDFGLVLEPLDRKRTWVLRFDSEEARSRWRHVLQYSSLKCSPPLFNMRDPLLTDAFKDAYARTRRLMGVQGYCALDRPEKEQLALLAAQACEVGPLAPLYRSIALAAAGAKPDEGSGGSSSSSVASLGPIDAAEADRLRNAIDKELDRLVSGVIDSAWPAILSRVELRRDTVEEIAEASLGLILREEEIKKNELREASSISASSPILKPCVRELSQPYLDIVTGALLKPLYKAHREAIKIFWHRIHDIVERGLKEQELRALYKDARWQYASLGPAFKKIRALTRGEVDDADASGESALKLLSELKVPVTDLVAMMQPVSLWEVEVAFEGSIRTLIGWAIYSFVAAVERARGRVTPIECLHAVMRAMLSDSKQRQRLALVGVLKSIIIPNARKNFSSIPQVSAALASSVAQGHCPASATGSVLPFAIVPYGSSAAAAVPVPLPSSAGAPLSPGGSGSGGGGAAAGGSNLIPIPSATPIVKNKKTLAAVQAEVRASAIPDLYFDNDWFVEEVFEECVGNAVAVGIEARVGAMLTKLDKLPGKLGFSAAM